MPKDWSHKILSVPFREGKELGVAYDIVSDYGNSQDPLDKDWWRAFSEALKEAPYSRFLLLSERPIPAELAPRHPDSSRIAIQQINTSYVDTPIVRVVLVDLSGVGDSDKRLEILKSAKGILVKKGPEDEPSPWRRLLEKKEK